MEAGAEPCFQNQLLCELKEHMTTYQDDVHYRAPLCLHSPHLLLSVVIILSFLLGWNGISVNIGFAFLWWLVRLNIFFLYSLPIYISSFGNYLPTLLDPFLIELISYLDFCILDINSLSDGCLAKVFSYSVSCLFTHLIVSFALQKLFFLISRGSVCQLMA